MKAKLASKAAKETQVFQGKNTTNRHAQASPDQKTNYMQIASKKRYYVRRIKNGNHAVY